MKSIPLGIENFELLRHNCYYVDHTSLIENVQRAAPTTAILILRPRRFGKSLALSMLQSFYEASPEKKRTLFGDLEVGKNKTLMEMEPKPTITLKLKDIKSPTYESFLNDFAFLLKEEYLRQIKIFGEALRFDDMERIINGEKGEDVLKTAVYLLAKRLNEISGQRIYLLIDEYDTPISQAKACGYFDESIRFFQFFYGKTLKGNDFIEKAVVTGIVRIAKQSLFSGANNFLLDDGLQTLFPEPCGFSYKECKELLDYYGVKDKFENIVSWYGGYRFGDTNVINPWSVLSFLYYNKRLSSYWVSTASNSELSTIFSEGNVSLASLTEMMQSDIGVKVDISENVNYQRIHATEDSFLLYLRGAGYLTLSEFTDDNGAILKIPNHEIELSLPREVIAHVTGDSSERIRAIYSIKEAFLKGDETALEKLIQDQLLSSFSYYDFGSEKAYQVMVLTLASLLFGESIVKSEVNSGEGRCDIIISPKNEGGFGAIIEIKYLKSRTSEQRLQTTSESALRQIISHRYYEELKERKANPIKAYGFAFQGKRVSIAKKTL
ncbi:MAG: AAA family ATPase [Bacilli bacterium]|nr:AAA family ATPase [Bacilli bacterium]